MIQLEWGTILEPGDRLVGQVGGALEDRSLGLEDGQAGRLKQEASSAWEHGSNFVESFGRMGRR